jgi:nucleoside-diphosphate-sugar epimerase
LYIAAKDYKVMESNPKNSFNIVVIGADTELGRETIEQLVAEGHRVTGIVQTSKNTPIFNKLGVVTAKANLEKALELKAIFQAANVEVVLNLAPQVPNTLLHDGHNWKDYDRILPTTTTALIEALSDCPRGSGKADRVIRLFVHTSYAFLYGNANNATEDTPLSVPSEDPIFLAAIQAEKAIANSSLPACVLRLGYLYGPQSEDLKKYEFSFKLRRPYFAGAEEKLMNFLHYSDAAKAISAIVERQPVGEVFNIVDGTPTAFANFIDSYALKLGYSKPSHIPLWTAPLARLIIQLQQMELLDISTRISNEKINQRLGWSPQYKDYKEGLKQTINTWRDRGELK